MSKSRLVDLATQDATRETETFKCIRKTDDENEMSSEQQTNAGIVVADATQQGCPMIYVSPGFERLTGYTSGEVVGRSCSLLQGPATDPRAVDVLRSGITEAREAHTTLVNYRKDGSQFWNEVSIAPEYDDDGRLVRYLGVQRDVTELIGARERMRELAYSDPLTGLGNRAALTAELDRALADAQQHEHQLALLFIDLDDFKAINDSHGHAAGDRLLAAVADRLRAETRPTDLLARPGGDEFLLLIRGDDDLSHVATGLAARIGESLSEPLFLPNGRLARVRASVGVSLFPQDAQTAEDLLKHSDRAMYVAKGAGKNRFHLYQAVSRKTGYRADPAFDPTLGFDELDRIIRERAIRPVFQPIIAIDNGEIVGYEALARGPVDSILERPDRLFAAAAARGRVTELDWLCRIRAVEEALDAGLGRSAALFINCEPSVIDAPCPEADEPTWKRAGRELELVLEITERAITGRPPSSHGSSANIAQQDGASRWTTSAPILVRWRCCRSSSPTSSSSTCAWCRTVRRPSRPRSSQRLPRRASAPAQPSWPRGSRRTRTSR